eukprot:364973-Chlamydomonas_euryale.AAC.3
MSPILVSPLPYGPCTGLSTPCSMQDGGSRHWQRWEQTLEAVGADIGSGGSRHWKRWEQTLEAVGADIGSGGSRHWKQWEQTLEVAGKPPAPAPPSTAAATQQPAPA